MLIYPAKEHEDLPRAFNCQKSTVGFIALSLHLKAAAKIFKSHGYWPFVLIVFLVSWTHF
jgi:hypothetical protein